MLADDAVRVVLDRAGLALQVAVEKFAKRPLANETDAGAVLLFRIGRPISAAMRRTSALGSSPTGNSVLANCA